MDKQKQLKDRLYEFALKIVQLVRALPKEMAALEIGKQLIRSGTSVAANYEEASSAFSKEDFVYKISISFRESKESYLWLRLLRDSIFLNKQEAIVGLIGECEEIANILARSLKTARTNLETRKQNNAQF